MITYPTNPSYDEIHTVCEIISDNLFDASIDCVLGISRGGLLPSKIISHILNVPMLPISYSSKIGKGDNKNHNNVLPTIYGDITSGIGEAPLLPILLLVDDICDSGKTLLEVTQHYKNQGHLVITASLYYKELEIQRFTPDHWSWKIPEDSPWINFPWES